MLEKNLVDVESMISAEYPIMRSVEAFDRAAEPAVLKVLITMDG